MMPEEIINDPKIFPSYEELEGNTEGEKLKNFSKVHKEIVGTDVPYPLSLTCGQCSIVCGPSVEENTKRNKALINGGIVAFSKGGEVVITYDYEEAVALRKKYPYKIPVKVRLKDNFYNAAFGKKIMGSSPQTKQHLPTYLEKLKRASAEKEISKDLSN